MIETVQLPDARLFEHEAMKTTFSLRLAGVDQGTASGVARECFELVDLLEARISRFIEGSDVWRINRMQAGETLYLSESCHDCLLVALDAHARTGGLFDITLGTRIEHRKSGTAGPPPPLEGMLEVHPDVPAITCREPGRQVDLGGIGKGFALEQVRKLLAEWGIRRALISAGASTQLAVGDAGWPVELAGERESLRITLANDALSASGTGIQGSHIVDPRGEDEASPGWTLLWLTAADAALADAFSTAAILMTEPELAGFVAVEEAITGAWSERDGRIAEIGPRAAS